MTVYHAPVSKPVEKMIHGLGNSSIHVRNLAGPTNVARVCYFVDGMALWLGSHKGGVLKIQSIKRIPPRGTDGKRPDDQEKQRDVQQGSRP